jgi:hypothetical protein
MFQYVKKGDSGVYCVYCVALVALVMAMELTVIYRKYSLLCSLLTPTLSTVMDSVSLHVSVLKLLEYSFSLT